VPIRNTATALAQVYWGTNMARIPTIQRRATLPTTTGVPAAPVVLLDDKTGQSLQAAGQVVSDIGENQLRARADAMVTQSFVNATLKMDELKQSIDTNKTLSWESDPESSQFNPGAVAPTADPEDVKARMAQIYETASEGLSPYGREKFDKDYSMLSAKGQIEIRREQVARDHSVLQKDSLALRETLIKTAIKDGSEVIWLANLKKGIDDIDSREVNRVYRPKEAENERQKFRKIMDAVKGDRLNENIVLAVNEGLRTINLFEDDADAEDRFDKVDKAIKLAVAFGSTSRKAGADKREAFKNRVADTMANLQMVDDPDHFLTKIKDIDHLPDLLTSRRSYYTKRAQEIIDRRTRKAETEDNKAERIYLGKANSVIESIAIPGTELTEEMEAVVSDIEIDNNIKDPDLRKELKLRRDYNRDFKTAYATQIRGKHPSEQAAALQEIQDKLSAAPIGNIAQAETSKQLKRQIDILQQGFATDLRARQKDTAKYVVDNDDAVKDALQIYESSVDQNAAPNVVAIKYAEYAAARDSAYARMGIDPSLRHRKLPESVVKRQVAAIMTGTADEMPQRIQRLSTQMGPDWSYMLGELQKNGLSEDASVLTIVTDIEAAPKIAEIVKNDGYKGLKEGIDTKLVSNLEQTINSKTKNLDNNSGIGATSLVNTMRKAMYMLALNGVRNERLSETEAVDNAIRDVVRKNYQIVSEARLKGIVPAGTIESSAALMHGLSKWIKEPDNLETIDLSEAPREITTDEDRKSWIIQNAQWTLTGDGERVELRSQYGKPVKDTEGNNIVLPLNVIETERLGAAGQGPLRSRQSLWARKLAEQAEKRARESQKQK